MGIRFACHHCNHAMHVKDFQGGKRGKCPVCNEAFRIPLTSSLHSIPVEFEGAGSQSPDLLLSPAASKPTNPTATTAKQKPAPVSSPKATEKKVDRSAENPTKGNASKTAARPSDAITEKQQSVVAVTPLAPTPAPTLPTAFQAAPNAKWFVRPPSGGEYGPATADLLTVWIQERRVTSDSFLWREGQAQWLTASQLLPELYANASEELLDDSFETNPETDSTIGFPESPQLSEELSVHDLFSPQLPLPGNKVASQTSSATLLKEQRRIQQKKNQLILIIVLALVSFALLCGLIVVLLTNRNASTSNPPSAKVTNPPSAPQGGANSSTPMSLTTPPHSTDMPEDRKVQPDSTGSFFQDTFDSPQPPPPGVNKQTESPASISN